MYYKSLLETLKDEGDDRIRVEEFYKRVLKQHAFSIKKGLLYKGDHIYIIFSNPSFIVKYSL